MKEVKPIVITIIICLFVLSLGAVGGGIYAIYANAISESKIIILGAEVKTGHVGVAFVFIGLVVFMFTVRYVLKVISDLNRPRKNSGTTGPTT